MGTAGNIDIYGVGQGVDTQTGVGIKGNMGCCGDGDTDGMCVGVLHVTV